MVGKKISDLTDSNAVNIDTLIEIADPIKETQSDGKTVIITGYRSLRATIGYIFDLLKNTAMSFPWLSVKGIDSFSELDAANGMQVKFNAADSSLADGNPAKIANVTVSGYGNSVCKMPMYAADIGFIISDDKGNFVSTVQAAKKDLSNVDMPTLVSKIDTQRGSGPLLLSGGTLTGDLALNGLKISQLNDDLYANGKGFFCNKPSGSLARQNWETTGHVSWWNETGDLAMWFDISGTQRVVNVLGYIASNYMQPCGDNTGNVGTPSLRYSAFYSTNGTIQTSDERLKDNIASIPDKILDVWETLSPWCQFTMIDSENDQPRLHLGAIAQRVVKAFSDAGEDAFAYGLACYDTWEESTRKEFDKMVEVVDPKTGKVSQQPSYKTVTLPAGDRYSLRYDECLVLEAALMRRTTERLAARVAELEK